MAKDPTRVRSLHRKLALDMQVRRMPANLTAGSSNWALLRATVKVRAKASTTEEPDAGKLHVPDCAGGAGQPASLRLRSLKRIPYLGFRRCLENTPAYLEQQQSTIHQEVIYAVSCQSEHPC